MHIGKVSGTVVATFKDKVFEGKKLLIVDHLTPEEETTGNYWIAVDDAVFLVATLLIVATSSIKTEMSSNSTKSPVAICILFLYYFSSYILK